MRLTLAVVDRIAYHLTVKTYECTALSPVSHVGAHDRTLLWCYLLNFVLAISNTRNVCKTRSLFKDFIK